MNKGPLKKKTRGSSLGGIITAMLFVALLGWTMAGAQSPAAGTLVTNQAEVTWSSASGASSGRSVSNAVQTAVSARSSLTLEKRASSATVAAGSQILYTIVYRNEGNGDALGVTIVDTMPQVTTYVSSSQGGTFAAGPPEGGTVTWNIGTVKAGEEGMVTMTALVNNQLLPGTVITNKAQVRSSDGPPRDAETTTIVGASPNLRVTGSAEEQIYPCETIHYTITYGNTGNIPATGAQVRHALPDGTALLPGSVSAGGRVDGRTIVWDLGRLLPGAQGTLSFQATVSPVAGNTRNVRNVSTIVSSDAAHVISNETITHVLPYTLQGPATTLRILNTSLQEQRVFKTTESFIIQVSASSEVIKTTKTVTVATLRADGTQTGSTVTNLVPDLRNPTGMASATVTVGSLRVSSRDRVLVSLKPG